MTKKNPRWKTPPVVKARYVRVETPNVIYHVTPNGGVFTVLWALARRKPLHFSAGG